MAPGFRFILRHLRSRLTEERSDAELLQRFAAHQDEEAFAALVERHGALVLEVCRRILHDTHDAEDAFQVTFLVLACKASSTRWQPTVGPWLYRVARQVALRARANAARRHAREKRAVPAPRPDPIDEADWRDSRPILEEELDRLPAKYRDPLILCCLEGKTHQEAAHLLGWPKGSISNHLARGRALLLQRLARRGITLPATVLTTVLARRA